MKIVLDVKVVEDDEVEDLFSCECGHGCGEDLLGELEEDTDVVDCDWDEDTRFITEAPVLAYALSTEFNHYQPGSTDYTFVVRVHGSGNNAATARAVDRVLFKELTSLFPDPFEVALAELAEMRPDKETLARVEPLGGKVTSFWNAYDERQRELNQDTMF